MFLVAASVHVGDWSDAELYVPGGGSGGFPLVVFDKEMNFAVVMAPASQFMAASQGVWKGMNRSSYIGFGLLGSLTQVRKDAHHRLVSVLYCFVAFVDSCWISI